MRPVPDLDVRVKIFGGLRVWRGTHEIDPGPLRQRVVLALLVAAAGEVVTVEHMVNVLWPTDPPPSATNQVQRLVGQVRRTFEPSLSPHASGQLVLAAASGYCIAAGQIGCDLFRFRELAALADECVSAEQVEKGCKLYVEALEQCRGPLFAGLDSHTLGLPEFVALERERESVVAAAAAAGVEHRQVPPQLVEAVQQAVARAPLNEALHEALLRVLAATGRRADALNAYDTMRRSLAEELGVDPGPQLMDTFHQLLAEAPGAQLPATPKAPEPRSNRRPAQLPRPPAGFVERTDVPEVRTTGSGSGPDEVKILAIGGMAGIGKTALAIHRAHQLIRQFPDGQLYLDLRGFSPDGRVVEPTDALARLLDSLGEPPSAIGDDDVAARSARYRSLVAGRRMIVVLDNARDSAHVRPLLPGSPTCLVIVTSRTRLTSLVAYEGAEPVDLDRLSSFDAHALIIGRIGPTRAETDPDALDRIVAACAGLPLALAIAGGRIATEPTRPLTGFAVELEEPGQRLDALATGEPHEDVRSLLSWSYRALSVDAARLLRLAAAHPGPEASLPAMASISGLTVRRVSQLADELAVGRLLTSTTVTRSQSARYALHDLVREYAAESLAASGDRIEAERRLVDHYLLATRNAFMQFGREPLVPIPAVSQRLVTEDQEGIEESLQWFARERSVLVAVVEIALARGMVLAAALIVLERRPMDQALDPLADTLDQCLRVLAAAGEAELPIVVRADLHRDAALRHRDGAQTDLHYARALELYRGAGDLAGQANVFRGLSVLAIKRDNNDVAYAHAMQAVALAERAGQPAILAMSLMELQSSLVGMEDHEEAVGAGERALAALRESRMTYFQPVALGNLAISWLALGQPQRALRNADAAMHLLETAPNALIEVFLVSCRAQAAFQLGSRDVAAIEAARFTAMVAGDGRARLIAIGMNPAELDTHEEQVNRLLRALDRG